MSTDDRPDSSEDRSIDGEDTGSPDSLPDGEADAKRPRSAAPEDAGASMTDASSGKDVPDVDGASPAAHDASMLPDSGSPDASMPWQPPPVSQVRMTGSSCPTESPPANGKCGGYYCRVSEAALALEIDPSKPCGNISAYVCTGELETITVACSAQAQAENLVALAMGETKAFAEDLNTCVKNDVRVMDAGVRETCLSCFTATHTCCVANLDCTVACLNTVDSTSCAQAMRTAGCMRPLFACSGLPDPF